MRQSIKLIGLLALVGWLLWAWPAASQQTPAPTFSGVSYGPFEPNVLDLWLASGPGPTPLVVYIHGGGFRSGDKSSLTRGREVQNLNAFLNQGISVAAINYRFRQMTTLDNILLDIARAIQYLRYRAEEWGLDPKRVAAYGGSAGGGASLWLAVHDDLADPDNPDPVLRQSTRLSVAGHLNSQATYDMAKWPEILGLAPDWAETMNVTDDLEFYGISSRDQYDDPEVVAIRAFVDMVAHLDAGDAPVYFQNLNPNAPPRNRGAAIHHPQHAIYLKGLYDALGIPSALVLATTPQSQAVDMLEFFLPYLKPEGLLAPKEAWMHSWLKLGTLFALCWPLGVLAQPSALQWATLAQGENERVYAVYAPTRVQAGPVPLVFLLHGGGGGIQVTWDREYGRSWRALADEAGFVLVLPQGRKDPGTQDDHHWNDCRSNIANPTVNTDWDDVAFVASLIEVLDEAYEIDRDRVYATGASNGGMMSYRLAIELGGRLAAVGALIANLPDPSECPQPQAPISVLVMNGTQDPLMPFEGGCVSNARCQRGAVRSTQETVAFWTAFNQTKLDPEVVALPDVVPADGSTVTVSTYGGGREGAEVVFYRVEGGGHTVPGPEPVAPARVRVAGPKNRDIDGPEEVWRFFQRHVRGP